MDELFGLMFCAMVTVVGLGSLVGLAAGLSWLGRRSKLAVLEAELDGLRGENVTLTARMSRLEAALSRLQASEPAVPPPPVLEWASWGAAARGLAEAYSPVVPDAARIPTQAPVNAPPTASPAELAASVPQVDPRMAPAVSEAAHGQAAQGPATSPTPASASAPSVPSPPARSIDWEQWIGVRGAAALGASILVLAGVYFFEYSIEHGLITPAMRMVLGTLVGLGCVLGSELRLRKTHAVLANWLAGAGIGILYVAFWAGRALYELYPTWAAGGLMVVTTTACVTLATRHSSKAIAALGLLGGFITPVALSTGSDRPIALFGYLLLLDGAMLWVAYRRRWAWLAAASLFGSVVYEAAWLFERLDEPRLMLGVGIIAAFSALFALASRGKSLDSAAESTEESWLYPVVRAAGILLPLFFTVGLAGRGDLGANFVATAVLLFVLSAAACFMGVRERSWFLPSAAGLAVVGALVVWSVAHPPTQAWQLWQVLGLAALEAVLYIGVAGWARRRDNDSAMTPAAVFLLGTLVVALFAAPLTAVAGPWPWLLVWGISMAGATWLGREGVYRVLPVAAALLSALSMGTQFAVWVAPDGSPPGLAYLGLMVLSAALVSALGLFGTPEARQAGDRAAGTFSVVLLVLMGLAERLSVLPSWGYLAAAIGLLFLTLLVAARRRHPLFMGLGVLGVVAAHGLWVLRIPRLGALELGLAFVPVCMVALFAALGPARLRRSAWTWRVVALAAPLSLLSLRALWLASWGDTFIGALPVSLGVVMLLAAQAARLRGPSAARDQRAAMVWLIAAAAGFGTLAIPMQLDNEWLTIGWALEALALTALWRRMNHTGLKYAALALAGAVCVRLLGNPYVLEYAGRGWPILNWLAYTYLVPAVSLVGMWALLREREPSRRRPWERSVLGEAPVLGGLVAAGAIALSFAWVNLTILDVFSVGSDIDMPFERLPARDLSLSIAWAVFALGLLALGMLRRSTALRGASLALILVTIAKVFLYDLGNLSDLYRVASLVGLALSLIVISLAYQRFVFRAGKEAA